MILLNVPYAEKGLAKSLQAKWSGKHRRWYIEDNVDPAPFYRWLPVEIKNNVKPLNEDSKLTLSGLLARVQGAVMDNFKNALWVKCEIASIKNHKSGHVYLELIETNKDGQEVCKNKAIIWKNSVDQLTAKFKKETGETIKQGMNVLLLMDVEFNIKFGLSLNIKDIDPKFTLGGIEEKINKIRTILKENNIYKKNKDFTDINDFTRLAVISPADAAGLGDFKAEADLLEFYELCEFDYYEATFQGVNTNASISAAFKHLVSEIHQDKYDAVIVIRGGGAKTDLNFLNEYDIAAAVCNCAIPVIVGIGHEIDKVILDEVAFASLDTPSKVAQFITQKIFSQITLNINNIDFIKRKSTEKFTLLLSNTKNDIHNIVNGAKNFSYRQLNSTETNLHSITSNAQKNIYILKREAENNVNSVLSGGKNIVSRRAQKSLNDISSIFIKSKETNKTFSNKINLIYKDIEGYNPSNIFKKGYSIVKKDNKAVKNINELKNNDTIEIFINNQSQKFKITKLEK